MPLEKYIPKSTDSSGGDLVKDKSDSLKDKAQRGLEDFRGEKFKKYKEKKEKLIAKVKEKVIAEDSEKADIVESKPEDRQKDRLKKYEQLLKEKSDLGEYTQAEILDYKLNTALYSGKGGWKEQYEGEKDKKSFEDFILEKQFEELDQIRLAEMEARTSGLVEELFPGLEKEEKSKEKSDKTVVILGKSKEFFQKNNSEIKQFLNGESTNPVTFKKELTGKFIQSVFESELSLEQLSANAPQRKLVEKFFYSLLDDYSNMLVQQEELRRLSPKMTQALSNNVTEEQWEKMLEEEAKKQAEKLKEENQKQTQIEQLSANTVSPAVYSTDKSDYSFTTSEKLGADSAVNLVEVPGKPGEYRIVFPNSGSIDQSTMLVRKVKDSNGQERLVYIFKDPLLDHPTMVEEKSMKAEVNSLVLDHAMNKGLVKGKDYLGPDLNTVLPDKQMLDLAKMLFYPKDLNQYVLKPADTEAFRRLMIVLTNSSNSVEGDSGYGNLIAIRNRVSLLFLALTIDGQSKSQQIFAKLANSSPDEIKKWSMADLCKSVGVPLNHGNFSKV